MKAFNLMANLKVWQKLSLIALVAVGLAVVPTHFYMREANKALHSSQEERRGIPAVKALLALLKAAQQHRGLSSGALTGSEGFAAKREAMAKEVQAAGGSLGQTLKSNPSLAPLVGKYEELLRDWTALVDKVARKQLTVAESFSQHNDWIERLLALNSQVTEQTELSLDPEKDSYNLIAAALLQAPQLAENVGQLRGFGVKMAISDSIALADRISLAASTGRVHETLEQVNDSLTMAFAANPGLAAKLEARSRASHERVKSLEQRVHTELLLAERAKLDVAQYYTFATEVADSLFSDIDAALVELEALLDKRIATLRAERRNVVITLAVLALLSTLLYWRLFIAMTRPLNAASRAAETIAAGDLSSKIIVSGRDEFGKLLASFADMQKKLRERNDHDRAAAAEMARLNTALDCVAAPVRVADNDGVILYLNHSMQKLLQQLEQQIRKHWPDFNADSAIGTNVSKLYQDPAAAMQRLRGLTATTSTRMEIGERSFDVVTSPITDADGNQLGTVGEWRDVTARLTAEARVASVIEAAAQGRLDLRVDVADLDGFFKSAGEGMNGLLETLAAVLQDVSRVVTAIAQGDLTQEIERDFRGEIALLKDNVNATVRQLRELVSNIRISSDAIDTAAREISAGNNDLSSRTEEQASSLEQTASAMEELTSTVKQNADNARQANQLALSASDTAVKGGEVVGQVVVTMSEINHSAKKIADIIGVIDGIAFQTNILALNAAVEAARAGEQGRGFAVVASEVRNLAQRSAAAAKEIKALIGDSVAKVEQGGQLVTQAGQTMEEVVKGVKRVTDIMGEISAASQEQSSGIEEVNRAIGQMDQVTQQNAALVEQAAAAAESLQEQAGGLIRSVAVFNLGANQAEGDKAVWDGKERRGADRATNVSRIAAKRVRNSVPSGAATALPAKAKKVAAATSNDEWTEF